MIPGKNHRFLHDALLAAFAVVDLFFLLFDEHEMPEHVQKTVALQNLFPKITGPISRRMLRIASATLDFSRMTSTIEREKMRLLPLQPCRHMNLVRIGSEMDESTRFKLKERRARIAIFLVL